MVRAPFRILSMSTKRNLMTAIPTEYNLATAMPTECSLTTSKQFLNVAAVAF